MAKKRTVWVVLELELDPWVQVTNDLLDLLGAYAAQGAERFGAVTARSWEAREARPD